MKRFFRCAAALLLLVCLLGITPRARALNRYLRVGLNPNTPPFQFQQADGTCAGMHVDMLTAIAEADSFEIEFVPFETDKACLEALRDGEIDLVLGEIATKANSTGDFCVTDSLTSSQLCVIVANDMLQSGKSARTAICVSDTIQHTLLANLGFHQFISVSNQIQLYQRHKELPSSAMIGVKDSLIYQLAQDGADKNYTVQYNYLGALEFTMVLRSADKELLRTMNTSINRFKATAQYENICSRWLPVSTREARFQRLFRIICVCAAFSALAVVGYVIITRRIQQVLHRQVAEQTEQIRSANQTLERQYAQLQTESDLRNRIIKYSPSGMMLIDLDGTVTLMNKSACAIAGVRQPLLGKLASDIPVFRDILEREGQRLFTSGTMVDRSILRLGDSPLHTRAYLDIAKRKGWQLLCVGDYESLLPMRRRLYFYTCDDHAQPLEQDEAADFQNAYRAYHASLRSSVAWVLLAALGLVATVPFMLADGLNFAMPVLDAALLVSACAAMTLHLNRRTLYRSVTKKTPLPEDLGLRLRRCESLRLWSMGAVLAGMVLLLLS